MKITQGPIGTSAGFYTARDFRQRIMDTIWFLSECDQKDVKVEDEGRQFRIPRARFGILMDLYQKAFKRYPEVRYCLYTEYVTISWGIDGLFDNMKPGIGFYKKEDLFQ